MKTTKTQAKEIYDNFFGIMRVLNGGTVDENKRNAPRCFERMTFYAEQAAEAVTNPAKRFRENAWLWEALNETLPARLKSFGERYNLTEGK
jgi:hypothetical protein